MLTKNGSPPGTAWADAPPRRGSVLIRGGLLTTREGQREADVRIVDGLVAEVGPRLASRQEPEVDARGLWVLPGGVDPHVHLSSAPHVPEEWHTADNFESGSRAALAGGVTTVGNMTWPAPQEGLIAALERDARLAELGSVDVVLHPVLPQPTEALLGEIARLPGVGATTLKIFLCEHWVPSFGKELERAVHLAGKADLLTLIHAEHASTLEHRYRELEDAGRRGFENYPDSRPVEAEDKATAEAVSMAQKTGSPIYLVHLSSAQALETALRGRAAGAKVFVETRPVYLWLSEDKYRGAEASLFAVQPPLRRAEDTARLWQGLERGEIDTLGSDHVGWSKAQKLSPQTNLVHYCAGVPDVQYSGPILFFHGVQTGRISPARFVELTSTRPAELLGLYPLKGALQVGSHGDVALWDPQLEKTVVAADGLSNAGYSLLEGERLKGWPVGVLRGGEWAFREGKVVAAAGTGRWLRRKKAAL